MADLRKAPLGDGVGDHARFLGCDPLVRRLADRAGDK
jgi:hypothetical protein